MGSSPSGRSQRPEERDPGTESIRSIPPTRGAGLNGRCLVYWYYIMLPSMAVYAHLTPEAIFVSSRMNVFHACCGRLIWAVLGDCTRNFSTSAAHDHLWLLHRYQNSFSDFKSLLRFDCLLEPRILTKVTSR
ncbi:hypothetical protein ACQJBY_022256 [Aegilops geniculata]